MARLKAAILEVARKEKPDVIHAQSPVLNAWPALWAGRRLGLPVIYEIRAYWEDAAVMHGTTTEGSLRYGVTRRIDLAHAHTLAIASSYSHSLRLLPL